MQVDLSTVLAILSTVLTIGFGAWLATARYALSQRDAEINRRIEGVVADAKAIDQRLHVEEKATIRQDGDLLRVKDTHSNLAEDLQEIKRTMVTKAEWNGLERMLDNRFSELLRASATRGEQRQPYQPRLTPGGYHISNPSASPPPPGPRKDKP